jgi:hypothetical protein
VPLFIPASWIGVETVPEPASSVAGEDVCEPASVGAVICVPASLEVGPPSLAQELVQNVITDIEM